MTRVCALVPHYACEQWLGQAVESLLTQSRPPDAIVVIDDASPQPPKDIVADFPGVTLVTAAENSGPYRLVQAVIDVTDFDAYLFQDADDWSAPDRLEVLLAEAAREDAELVGSHEVRVLVDQADLLPVRYPLDVNAALADKPTSYPLLHPTSLVSRSLVQRLGGFATGMRFSGDAEFLRRAAHVARVVNADHFGYFRRKRAGSLTLSPETGFGSPERLAVQEALRERAQVNAERMASGGVPDLSPWRVAGPVDLRRVGGPRPGDRPVTWGWTPSSGRTGGERGPVFVIGPPRSGADLLGWALGQHPAFTCLVDGRWLARAASDVAWAAGDESVPAPSAFRSRLAAAIGEVAGEGTRTWVASGGEVTDAAWALAELFADSRFLFVTRSVEETVAAVLAAPTEGGVFHTRDLAVRRWASAVRTGLDLGAALGRDRVLRVDHTDLVSDPAKVLQEVLTFLGAECAAACLRPFTGMPDEVTDAPVGEPESPALAEQVTELVFRLAEPQPAEPDPAAARLLARVFQRRRTSAAIEAASLVDKVRAVVGRIVPEGSVVVMASKGDPRLVELGGSVGWHFPQVDGGTYAGHHPADSAIAIAHLEELRALGGEYFVLPATQFWWLTYYEDLRRHLERCYRVVAYEEGTCLVYALTGAADPAVPLPAGLALNAAGSGG